MPPSKPLSLKDFIAHGSTGIPKEDLSSLLGSITAAAVTIHGLVNRAGLANITGNFGTVNVSGDEVKKLDIISNDIIINELKKCPACTGVASEENENFIPLNEKGKYTVTIDPLDGSSNIDVNVSVGTIFSVYKRVSASGPCTQADFLQKGAGQVAAGYVIYGTSVMLVFTTGQGVNGFTLEPSEGAFYLSNPDIKIPASGKVYSVNEGSFDDFPDGLKAYLYYCKGYDKPTRRPYTARYIGSMVADVHRNLLKGGIFIYPATKSTPQGKLRLLYECNPLSFLVEQAGGRGTDGKTRIVELQPTALHQRTPVYLGSAEMVQKAEFFLNQPSSMIV